MPGVTSSGAPPRPTPVRFEPQALLKADLLGRVQRGHLSGCGAAAVPAVERDAAGARPWLRRPARWLAAREARALAALEGCPGVPRLLHRDRSKLWRTWIEGRPLHQAAPEDPNWFAAALRLLARLHRRGVTHNDLAKEPNWIVTPSGGAALVDFQLARVAPSRGPLFRLLAREDLRHLCKHKRTYCPRALTPRERALLARPSPPARAWRALGKPLYLGLTRGLLGWADREGAGERGAPRINP